MHLAILLWLGLNKISCCIQISTLDALEKVVDYSDIVNATL